MLNLPLYQVDAFTDRLFGGNPAAVVPLPQFLPDDLMQSIAAENNLSETAFVVVRGEGEFDIRWFTPTAEVRLCGHATLAAAHVMYRSGNRRFSEMEFQTQQAGALGVRVHKSGRYQLDLPADMPRKERAPKDLPRILGVGRFAGVYRGEDDILVVLNSEKQITQLEVDLRRLAKLTRYRGMIVTAPGKQADFVSRCFYPQTGIDEDPVTGSAHALLVPYWASRFGRKKMTARQLSARGGELACHFRGKTVRLSGNAVTYSSGQIYLEENGSLPA